MNLLNDQWVPVRRLEGGKAERIILRHLLCGDEKWELCLPRDDMELAAMQLLICITQALITPITSNELKNYIAKPLSETDYEKAAQPYADWFQLDHPKYPFMQVLGVEAKDATHMDKLLAGVTGATNSCFVNQAGLADGLCPGCTAIALFNQASCTPSFGGGFKAGLRGSSPITTLIQGDHLRRTIWLNILAEDSIQQYMPWHESTRGQEPTWITPIKSGEIKVEQVGFLRGLFWQPAYIEMQPPVTADSCSCCGMKTDRVFKSFNKAKFNFTITGTWPHPHSPRVMTTKRDQKQEKYAAFTTAAPAWTQLSRFVVQQEIDETNAEGQQPAAVILQIRKLYGPNSQRLHLLIGGYRASKASIIERRHEVFTLNHGWDQHTSVIHHMVSLGCGYRDALKKAIGVFVSGMKDVKGAKVKMNQRTEMQFYRRAEPVIENTLSRIEFANAEPELTRMRHALKDIAQSLFKESVRPYLNDPELIRTLAVARKTLYKHLNNLEPQNGKGGDDGTTEKP